MSPPRNSNPSAVNAHPTARVSPLLNAYSMEHPSTLGYHDRNASQTLNPISGVKFMQELQIGDIAPNFVLPGSDNQNFELKYCLGSLVVLYFYPKDDTSGCTAEAIDFNRLKPEFEKIGAQIIGISPDALGKHTKFKQKHNLNLTLLSDEEKTVLSAYGVWVEKSMYGRKYMGVERTTCLIDRQGKIAGIWRKVKVTGHADAVLERARSVES